MGAVWEPRDGRRHTILQGICELSVSVVCGLWLLGWQWRGFMVVLDEIYVGNARCCYLSE